jgi:hypothetical protein
LSYASQDVVRKVVVTNSSVIPAAFKTFIKTVGPLARRKIGKV